jgi:hypothetical protein
MIRAWATWAASTSISTSERLRSPHAVQARARTGVVGGTLPQDRTCTAILNRHASWRFKAETGAPSPERNDQRSGVEQPHCWSNTGQLLVKYWSIAGQILFEWANPGLAGTPQ